MIPSSDSWFAVVVEKDDSKETESVREPPARVQFVCNLVED